MECSHTSPIGIGILTYGILIRGLVSSDKHEVVMTYSAETMDVGDQAMAAVGVSHIAYIRPIAKGGNGYAVCSADGRQLAVFPNYDAAFFTARQYNLAPVNVH